MSYFLYGDLAFHNPISVLTVYQLARLDTCFRNGLCAMSRALDCPFSDDPIDYLAFNYGYAKGALDSLFYNHRLDLSMWVDLSSQLGRLHDLILSRL